MVEIIRRNTAQPMIRTTVMISPEMYGMAKQHHVQFSEAIRVGISILLSERGVQEYDNNLNLWRKMKQFQSIAESTSQKVEDLQRELALREKLQKFESKEKPENEP